MPIKSIITALLVSSVSTIAMAQTYSKVVSFGDSLSDNGNFGAGGPPAPYFNSRYSNGPTTVEVLAGALKPQTGPNGTMYNFGQAALGGNVNYAFGGARADNNPNSNGPVPAIQAQIGAFALHGGTLNATSLVTLQGGANDIFQTPGIYNPATIANSALQMRNAMNTLGAMGAKNLLIMNLPDLGTTPAYVGLGPAAQAGGTLATNAYNTALATQITAVRAANPTMNVISMNVNALASHVAANAAAFGFTNTTAQCILTPACVGGSAATQNAYFFWDSVHPTAAAHRMFAAMAQQMVQYGTLATGVSALAETGLQLRQSLIGRSFDRVANARFGAWPSEKGEVQLIALYDHLKGNGYSGNVQGAQLNYARSSASGLAYGGALSAQFGSVSQGLLAFSPVSLSVDGWASRKFGASFVNFAAGASYNSFGSYTRNSGIGNLATAASPNGSSLGAALQIGHGFKMGSATLTPSGALSVINAKVGGYSESGLLAPLAVSSRSLTAVTGSAEMRADAPLTAAISGHGLIGYQGLLSVSGNSITATLADQPVAAITTQLNNIAGSGVYVGAGLGGKTAAGLALNLDYRASFVSGSNHKLTGGVKIAF